MKNLLLVLIALFCLTKAIHHIGVSVIPGSDSHHFVYRKILSDAQKTGRYKFHILIHNNDLKHWDTDEFDIFPFGDIKFHLVNFKNAVEKVQHDPVFGVNGFHEMLLTLNEEILDSGFKDYLVKNNVETFITDMPNFSAKYLHTVMNLKFVFYLLPACIQPVFMEEFYVNPSNMPFLNVPYPLEMTFFQRIWNYIQIHATMILYTYFNHDESLLYHKRGINVGSSYVIPNSVVMGQCLDGIHFPYERPPNFRDIGPVLAKPAEPLKDETILAFIGKWPKVVYMSQGTIMSILDFAQLKSFFAAFPEIGFIFSDRSVDISLNFGDNVLPLKWVPQNDLLGHDKVVVFITHGGLNSLYEGIYNATPMLVLGIAIDQANNAGITTYREIGVAITSRSDISAPRLIESMKELLGNPKYAEKIKALSVMMKRHLNSSDKFIAALDEAFEIGVEHLQLEGMKQGLGITGTFGRDTTLIGFALVCVMLHQIYRRLKKRIFR